MQSTMNFKSDLKVGQKGEKVVIDYLTTQGMTYVSSCDTKSHDFVMTSTTGEDVKYEVKTDVYKPVKNLCIEVESRGKPSGVITTTADVFVNYFYHINQLWIMDKYRLKAFLNAVKPDRVVMGGDNYTSKLYLYDMNRVKEYFNVVQL